MRDAGNPIRNDYDEHYVEVWTKKPGVEDLPKECLEMLEENYAEGYDS